MCSSDLWANCFRAHKELTMNPLGKLPLAPSVRGLQRTATPIPEVRSPLKELIPVESSAGPSLDKGKGRAIEAMDKGKLERARSVRMTVSKYKGAFHGGSSAFVYNWIDDAHGDSNPEGPQDSIEDWMLDQSYQDATEEPIE